MDLEKVKRGEIKNLSGADLIGANLIGANLKGADLRGANLIGADLRGADLRGAYLRGANLIGANLKGSDLSDAYLIGADLRHADLSDAYLIGSNSKDIKVDYMTVGYNIACPEEGEFIGYKKANGYLVKLLILEDSKRSSATTSKCRCDKAKVLDIEDIETSEKINSVSSEYDENFIYTVGEIVKVDDFDEDRWNECTTGIHFFVNKENAINF